MSNESFSNQNSSEVEGVSQPITATADSGNASGEYKGGISQQVFEPQYGILFSTWLGILSLFVAIQADVFILDQNPLRAIANKPFSCICENDISPAKLSVLLNEGSTRPQAAATTSTSLDNNMPIYAFALDISGSMVKERIIDKEIEEYKRSVKGCGLLDGNSKTECTPAWFIERLERKKSANSLEIAQLELCRYINLVPNHSQAAIWKFGKKVTPLKLENSRDKDNNSNDWLSNIEETRKGGDTRIRAHKAILSGLTRRELEPSTDFEVLMDEFQEKYRQVNSERETHFIIISDFAHDIDGGEYFARISGTNKGDLPVGSTAASQYRHSFAGIARGLRTLVRKGVIFHFVEVSGAHREVFSILPFAKHSLSTNKRDDAIYSYRETKLLSEETGSNFDFLRAIEDSKQVMTFYYTPGNPKAISAEIEIDNDMYSKSDVRFTLVSRSPAIGSLPLKLKLTSRDDDRKHLDECGDKGEKEGELSVEKGGATCKNITKGNRIILEPENILEPREANNQLLLISWEREGYNRTNASNDSSRKTYAIGIKFDKRLNWWGAFCTIICMLVVVSFGVLGMVKSLIILWIKLKKRAVGISFTTLGEIFASFLINCFVSLWAIRLGNILSYGSIGWFNGFFCPGLGWIILANIVSILITSFILLSNYRPGEIRA